VAFDPTAFIERFRDGYRPKFSSDGAELSFYASSYSAGPRHVVLRASGYAPPTLDYLALGDSYSSGEGDTDDKYYTSYTNDEFEKCHNSTRSYPYLIAATLGIDKQYMKSVACSGATGGDVTGEDAAYWGQGGRLGEKYRALSKDEKNDSQSFAKDSFIPGRIHQIVFVKTYKPKVITIGIGGNDVGFMDKLRTCVGLGTCTWAGRAIDREKTALEIKKLFQPLVDTYTAIHGASPNSKIYAIGYPKIIDPTGECSYLYGKLLDSDETMFINEGIIYLNRVIAAAAQRAGIKYVNIEDSFGSQVLCGDSKPSVMNGIRLGDDSSPWDTLPWFKIIGQESFHPQPSGHTKIAEAILQAVPDTLTYNYCPEGVVVCPSAIEAPEPSGYWLVDGITHNYESLHIASFTQDREDVTDERQKTISLGSNSFAPNSVIRTEIQSDPVELGSFVADETGAAKFNVELPQNLEEGFHTLHLYGTSYSGEQIDLYEVIQYKLPSVVIKQSPQMGIVQVEKQALSSTKVTKAEGSMNVTDAKSPFDITALLSGASKPRLAEARDRRLGNLDYDCRPIYFVLICAGLIFGATYLVRARSGRKK
jgi:lysophospholipase L1-like esterase